VIRIILIGLGQFGSRHLQSLANLEEESNIYLVDNSKENIDIAVNRFNDVYNSNFTRSSINLISYNSLNNVSGNFDVAIISSVAEARFDILKNLLERASVKFLILEKFLFQSIPEYKLASDLLKKSSVVTYVNQWISSNYQFRRIQSWFGPEKLKMTVSGGDWGLACNSPHFVDLFESFTREKISSSESSFDSCLPAKRKGYFEFFGSLKFSTNNGSILSLQSTNISDKNIKIRLENEKKKTLITIGENQDLEIQYHHHGQVSYEKSFMPFQSVTTSRLIQQLMNNEELGLPNFDDSSRQHQLLLLEFLNFFRANVDSTASHCPIT